MNQSIRAVCCCCFWLLPGGSAFAACTLSRVMQMPLMELGSHYAILARIDDAVRPMIVDTGAAATVLDARFVDDLGVTPDPSVANLRPVLGLGQTEAEIHPNVIPSVLAFGDLAYRDRSTVVAKMDFGNLPENQAAGLLGDDILSKFDVEFDFPSKKLTFYRASGCYGTFTPWTGAYAATPFLHERAKVVIDVILNAERTRAIVDTGNNGSFVSRSALALRGVSDAAFLATGAHGVSPLNGGSSFGIEKYTFDKIKIGDEVFPSTTMGIAEVDFPLGSVNLGLDYWKTRRVWFSYPNQWMFIARNASETTIAYPVEEMPPPAADGATRDNRDQSAASAQTVWTAAQAPDRRAGAASSFAARAAPHPVYAIHPSRKCNAEHNEAAAACL